MSYFEMMLATINGIFCCGGFNDVNYNVIRDTLIFITKNKVKLQEFVDDCDFIEGSLDFETCMSSIIYARLESMLTKEREVELFERLFVTVCKVIDEQ